MNCKCIFNTSVQNNVQLFIHKQIQQGINDIYYIYLYVF